MRPSFWSGMKADEWNRRVVDLAIVGAGFAGLSTAYHCLLARPDLDVLMVERLEPGAGASGRNAGMVIPFPLFQSWLVDASPSRRDAAWAHAAWRDMLAELIDTDDGALIEARDADIVVTSQNLIWTAGLKWVGRRARDLGIAVQTMDSEEVARRYGGGGAFGISYPGWSIQPWNTAQNLKRKVLALGARIAEGTEVLGIGQHEGNLVLSTSDGPIRARRVVICTNAYSGLIDGVGAQGEVLHTYMLATEKLPADIRARLGGERAMVSELGAGMIYRRVHDDRLLFGALDLHHLPPNERSAQSERGRSQLRALLARSLPWLKAEIEREWGGAFVGRESPPNLSASEKLPGLFFNTGYGGSGVSLTLPSGQLVRGLIFPELDDPTSARLRLLMRETRLGPGGLFRAGLEILGRY